MKSVLVFNDLWKYTEGTEIKLTADAQDWIRKDSKALALINLSITHSQLNHVKKATTSKEAWDGLKAVFESRARDEIPTLENLKIKLIEEEARQSDRVPKTSEDHNNNDALLAKGRSERSKWSNAKPKDSHTKASAVKFSGKCFNCGKSGHMSRFCKAKPKRSEANDATEAMTAIACKAEIINKSNTWYLDSGATRHMCNNESAFATLKNDERIKVHTASEHFVESGGRGDIKLDAKSNRQLINQVKLKNALYVPELRNNLLSVSSITDNGYTVKFEKDRATVNRKNGSCLDSTTPFEAWTQRKPYVGFFRTIGSKTIALNKNQRGKKFQPKGDEYLLVGYSEESKAYRLWKPGTKTVIKARDVKFFERIESSPPESSTGKVFTTPNIFIEMSDEEVHNEDVENKVREDSEESNEENLEDESDFQTAESEENEPRRGPGPAMKKEYNTLQENKTWTLVPRPADKKILTNRWVFKTKVVQDSEIKKYKARLVARGNTQEWGVDYEEVFAPVARYETIRTLLAASVNEEMYVHQMDVISAYVQGELNDEIYMEQPEMFVKHGHEEKVCKLLKPLYGLKQSGREWYKKLDNYITKIGGKRVKSKMKAMFKMVDLGQINNVLEISVQREGTTGRIYLSQKKYIEDLIEKFDIKQAKEASTPIKPNLKITKEASPSTEEERQEMKNRPYRELIGGLIYLANATRPDISFAAATLSRFCTDPGRDHWLIAKRVLRYLKATSHYGISYTKDEEHLKAYFDSDWAGDIDDRKSCSGNVLMLAMGPISWKSRKQASVALSTMEAEYAALSEVSREVVYLKRLLIHMGFEKYVTSPINVFCDNQSAIELSKNAVFHKRSKHIDINFHFTRELVDKKKIVIHYLQTDSMLADILTKSLTKCKHEKCIQMLNLSSNIC
ncbi:hypothetical protein PUN28_008790 [Cardiocondyla obscurior]|uniref:CCHC-type domain-containing protein n=2 Tax=Cardiocondyla obscurior TaxID=286306 RepID=A0AAW2FQT1_9HYME